MKSDIKTVSSKLDGLTLVIKDHIMTTIPVNPISPAKMKIKRKQTRDKIYKLWEEQTTNLLKSTAQNMVDDQQEQVADQKGE